MLKLGSSLSILVLAASGCLATLGCRAQTSLPPAHVTAGQPLPTALAFRIDALLRRKSDIPPESTINLSNAMPSNVPGFSKIGISITNEGHTSRNIEFLVSNDGNTLEQVNSYDISKDPRSIVSDTGRPARGGPETAPVLIVGFDDLECPFCARLNSEIFPALTQRYGDKVRIVYRDFPLDQHPWAMHAAVDVNCLAEQSGPAYWSAVDYIHAHASDIGADPANAKANPTIDRAYQQLDAHTREQGEANHLNMNELNACIAKQDTKTIEASKQLGEALNISSTPTLFINGEKIEGAVSLQFIDGLIDNALRAEGVTPPPPYIPPTPAAPATPETTKPAPAAK